MVFIDKNWWFFQCFTTSDVAAQRDVDGIQLQPAKTSHSPQWNPRIRFKREFCEPSDHKTRSELSLTPNAAPKYFVYCRYWHFVGSKYDNFSPKNNNITFMHRRQRTRRRVARLHARATRMPLIRTATCCAAFVLVRRSMRCECAQTSRTYFPTFRQLFPVSLPPNTLNTMCKRQRRRKKITRMWF